MNRFGRAELLLSVAAVAQLPFDEGCEVAFAGRSNAGKSSAINAITGHKTLARTSKTPGRTRLLNYFLLQKGPRIVDLPGYGYADVPGAERRRWMPLLDALRDRTSLHALFLIVDSRRGLRDEDLALIEWADPARRRVHVLLAKADKLKRAEAGQALSAARRALGSRASAQLFSAHDGTGIKEAAAILRSAGEARIS
jgi:GTP-binding protein